MLRPGHSAIYEMLEISDSFPACHTVLPENTGACRTALTLPILPDRDRTAVLLGKKDIRKGGKKATPTARITTRWFAFLCCLFTVVCGWVILESFAASTASQAKIVSWNRSTNGSASSEPEMEIADVFKLFLLISLSCVWTLWRCAFNF